MDQSDKALAYMRRVHQEDPQAIEELINRRVPCNRELFNDLTCVCEQAECDGMPIPVVGPLGLINGLLAELGLRQIASTTDEPDGVFTGFQRYPGKVNTGDEKSAVRDTRSSLEDA